MAISQGNFLKLFGDEYNKIIFFDTETSGLEPDKCQIIELAMVIMEKKGDELQSTEYDQFISLHDGGNLPQKIVELTGITDDMLLAEGIPELQAARDFFYYASTGKVLAIAHNAHFDLRFVKSMMSRCFGRMIAEAVIQSMDWIDSMTVLKDRKTYPHKLQNAIEYYHLQNEVQNSHRAIDDVKALAAVCAAMAKERNDVLKYVNVFGYNPKYGVSGKEQTGILYLEQPYTKGRVRANEILPTHFAY